MFVILIDPRCKLLPPPFFPFGDNRMQDKHARAGIAIARLEFAQAQMCEGLRVKPTQTGKLLISCGAESFAKRRTNEKTTPLLHLKARVSIENHDCCEFSVTAV